MVFGKCITDKCYYCSDVYSVVIILNSRTFTYVTAVIDVL